MEVIGGLNNISVQRLKKTWAVCIFLNLCFYIYNFVIIF